VGGAPIHEERRTDKQKKGMTKIIGDFRDNANAPKLIYKCTGGRIKGESRST
jgi:hypothetical protein